MTKDRIIETLGSELLNKRGLAQKLGFEIFMPEALMRSGKKDESLDMWRIAHCSITTLKIPLVARSANKICLHKLPRGGGLERNFWQLPKGLAFRTCQYTLFSVTG